MDRGWRRKQRWLPANTENWQSIDTLRDKMIPEAEWESGATALTGVVTTPARGLAGG